MISGSNNIYDEIVRVIKHEAETVLNLIKYIDNDFIEAVKLIQKSQGRIVVAGIGKSAHIANKIVATLNSTGTPAIFLHAADAIHGDLGMVQKNDIVICISKSGNTPEIKVLAPLIKTMGNSLIAIVSNKDSYLAQNADLILNAYAPNEACPNNLAPTSSSTAQLVIGDALAVALLESKGFGTKDFAKFHPGGALGKKLYLTVADICKQNNKPQVDINDSVETVLLEITSKLLGATVVTDNDEIVGVITDGDIRRMLQKHKVNFTGIKAKDFMSANPLTINNDTLAAEAISIMESKQISQLIITEEDKYVGMIHFHDLLKEGFI